MRCGFPMGRSENRVHRNWGKSEFSDMEFPGSIPQAASRTFKINNRNHAAVEGITSVLA